MIKQPKRASDTMEKPSKLEAELEKLMSKADEERVTILSRISEMAAMEAVAVQYITLPAYNSD